MTEHMHAPVYEPIEEDEWLTDHIRDLPPPKIAIQRDKWEAIYQHRRDNFPMYLVRQSDEAGESFFHSGRWIVPL